jgi:hypothetical protein
MALGDDLRKQQEQWRRLLEQFNAPGSSSFLELTRVLKEHEERYKEIGRSLDALAAPIQITNPFSSRLLKL